MHKRLKIGFVGAGKVGCALSRYLAAYHFQISGFLSVHPAHALRASQAINGTVFSNYHQLATACDWIFLTVPDTQIVNAINHLAPYLSQHHLVFHCSGALPAQVLQTAVSHSYRCCALHPATVFSTPDTPLTQVVFTIEGRPTVIQTVRRCFAKLDNPIQPITAQQKAKYHAACVFSSNLVNSLVSISQQLFQEIGFDDVLASQIILGLATKQLHQIQKQGFDDALTGPIKRGDIITIKRHLVTLTGPANTCYRLLSLHLLERCHANLSSEVYATLKKELISFEKYN